MVINMKENLKIKGYTNTWYVIEETLVDNKLYYLLENEEWGDETCWLLTDKDFNVICDTYDDIITTLNDYVDM